MGHFVRNKEDGLQYCIREEAMLTEESLNCWLQSFTLHANLKKARMHHQRTVNINNYAEKAYKELDFLFTSNMSIS